MIALANAEIWMAFCEGCHVDAVDQVVTLLLDQACGNALVGALRYSSNRSLFGRCSIGFHSATKIRSVRIFAYRTSVKEGRARRVRRGRAALWTCTYRATEGRRSSTEGSLHQSIKHRIGQAAGEPAGQLAVQPFHSQERSAREGKE